MRSLQRRPQRIVLSCFATLWQSAFYLVFLNLGLIVGCNSQQTATPLPDRELKSEATAEISPMRPFHPPVEPGDKVPVIEAAGWLNGQPTSNQGVVTVIDLWAKW